MLFLLYYPFYPSSLTDDSFLREERDAMSKDVVVELKIKGYAGSMVRLMTHFGA
jgi:hypothetical protein